jgi:hypothetical protein
MIAFLKSNISPRAVLAVAAMTLVVSVVMGREKQPPTVVALAAPATAPGKRAEHGVELDLQKLGRSKSAEDVPDLFAPRTPVSPPAPEVVNTQPPSPPPAPAAPTLPFTYLGQFIDGAKTEIFVARGAEHYSVEKGRTIAGQYRVEKITKTAVTFIYLPLGTRQNLAIPELK